MKTLKLIALAACALLFSQCKTTAPTAPTGPSPSILEVQQILDSTEIKFIAFANQTGGDPWQAIELTTDWILNQPNVKNAYYMDSTYITIQLNSGLETGFYLDLLNDSGYSIFRGGGGKGLGKKPSFSSNETLSLNKIQNKKVLIFAADTKTLPAVKTQIQKTVNRLANSGLGLDITVLQNEQCSYGVVEHFGDYGLVIMDTHGSNDAFLVGSTLDLSSAPKTEEALKSLINTQAGAGTSDKISSGSLKLISTIKANVNTKNWQKSLIPQSGRELFFTSKYLDLLPPMPNTIILGNMCYSGSTATSYYIPPWRTDTLRGPDGKTIARIIQRGGGNITIENPIRPAFSRKNLISYYGYIRDNPPGSSRPVPDDFAAEMEDSLVKRFVANFDSTKIANLKSDNTSEFFDPPHIDPSINLNLRENLYLRHFGADDYSYDKGCVTQFTDARDGQVYKAVCIGTQNWMAQNLNYNLPGSECYDSLSSNCDTYGRLYRHSMVMAGAAPSNANPSGVQGICPKGWHVPSASEWDQLITFLGGTTKAGGALKSTSSLWATSINKVATNSSGFSALPSGEWVDDNAAASKHDFFNLNYYGFYHTSSELTPNQVSVISLDYNSTNAAWATYPATIPPVFAGNVACRCVKDP